MTSLILQRFSELINDPNVLIHPRKYLGRHYKKVLEFWNKIENLTQEQLRVVEERYEAFFDENHSEWDEIIDLAYDASEEVIGGHYANNAVWAAVDVTKFGPACWATREIIGNVTNPTFLPMFDNL